MMWLRKTPRDWCVRQLCKILHFPRNQFIRETKLRDLHWNALKPRPQNNNFRPVVSSPMIQITMIWLQCKQASIHFANFKRHTQIDMQCFLPQCIGGRRKPNEFQIVVVVVVVEPKWTLEICNHSHLRNARLYCVVGYSLVEISARDESGTTNRSIPRMMHRKLTNKRYAEQRWSQTITHKWTEIWAHWLHHQLIESSVGTSKPELVFRLGGNQMALKFYICERSSRWWYWCAIIINT